MTRCVRTETSPCNPHTGTREWKTPRPPPPWARPTTPRTRAPGVRPRRCVLPSWAWQAPTGFRIARVRVSVRISHVAPQHPGRREGPPDQDPEIGGSPHAEPCRKDRGEGEDQGQPHGNPGRGADDAVDEGYEERNGKQSRPERRQELGPADQPGKPVRRPGEEEEVLEGGGQASPRSGRHPPG
ncbi:hypothetical protein A2495_02790 [Candidatus Curtissbacteria bacterium RIFOXYC12_FULL_41_11]|nr:MAG: hypothetical protein A2495_02790 [Candidatus Curtissbacteria bacterium RIFOXYC12_FULL_41_11]